LVVGHGVGLLPGSWQQTDTHWLPVTTTVAVVVSLVPVPLSVPGAAPPSSCVTPSQGSAPIWKAELAGVATIVAVLPAATDAVTLEPVDALPPLIVTEHQLKKFITVRVTSPPPPPSPAVAAWASVPPSVLVVDEGYDDPELLLHATAPAIANAPMLPTPSLSHRFIVVIIESLHGARWLDA
jgi:hypothetical protein